MLIGGNTTRIYLSAGGTDMRKGFEGLYALVKDKLALDPLSGHLFVFCNRGCNRIKVLHWDGSGLWICAKRLEKGRFAWPKLKAEELARGVVQLSPPQWTMLIEGIDLRDTQQRKWYRLEEGEKSAQYKE